MHFPMCGLQGAFGSMHMARVDVIQFIKSVDELFYVDVKVDSFDPYFIDL